MKFTKEHQDLFAEKILDLGNLSLVGLTFASLLTQKFNFLMFLLGIVIFIICYMFAYNLIVKQIEQAAMGEIDKSQTIKELENVRVKYNL